MRQKIKLGMTLILLIGMILLSKKLSQIVTNQEMKSIEQIVMIDPGHGGEDPGKVGVNGALEKDVNLQIAQKLKRKLEANGIQVQMTREDDSVPSGKKEDMKQRVSLIEKLRPMLVVSIHQNSFTDEAACGAQVFYYTESEEGAGAAQIVQNSLLEFDPSNTRTIKGNTEYYMLKKTSVPIIIVECGFLSNPKEAESLILNEYQEEIAEAICTGILKWLDK